MSTTKAGMMRFRIGGDDMVLHEFATIAPGEEPVMRIRITADQIEDPDRLFEWPPLPVGYGYPPSEAARIRVRNHDWIARVLPVVQQAKELRVRMLRSQRVTPKHRLAGHASRMSGHLPPGMHLRMLKSGNWVQILVEDWPSGLHYELTTRESELLACLLFKPRRIGEAAEKLRPAFDALDSVLRERFGQALTFRNTKVGSLAIALPLAAAHEDVVDVFDELVTLTREPLQHALEVTGMDQAADSNET